MKFHFLFHRNFVLTLSGLIISSCGSRPSESTLDFFTGAGPLRGHEDITRFAVDDANHALGYDYFPKISAVSAGASTHNPLLKGNFESDYPSPKLRAFYSAPADVNWHNEGNLQAIHGLRGRIDGIDETVREACQSHTKVLKNAALKGFNLILTGDKDEGLYWIGHATHIIQDAFSSAHETRTGENGIIILDYCTYGHRRENACFHRDIDGRDRIWDEGFRCQFDPNSRQRECLTKEANWAVNASSSFLQRIARARTLEDLNVSLQKYLEIAEDIGSGAFDCQDLPPA
ncbi:MAG: hypothetical protein H7249_15770 [Chitinophagaceae bacterium]|nr:hypothetical protein [Oligoflexus sp.]